MQKTVRNRLEALERRTAAVQGMGIGPLTEDDCWLLRNCITHQNVTLGNDGRAVSAWESGNQEQLDTALTRCNVALARLGQARPRTTDDLDLWLCRQLPYTPPAFEDALGQLDRVLTAIEARHVEHAMFSYGSARIAPSYFLPPWEAIHTDNPRNARIPDDERQALDLACRWVSSYIVDMPDGPKTMSEIAAWVRQYRRLVAFDVSLTWDEIDLLEAMDGTDPLFYTADQRALSDRYDGQVGEIEDSEQWRADAEAHPVKADLFWRDGHWDWSHRHPLMNSYGRAAFICPWSCSPDDHAACPYRECRACVEGR